MGYDHNWCLNNGRKFAKVATLEADRTELKMDVYTDLPGVQIYTGNFIVAETGKAALCTATALASASRLSTTPIP
jgi:aldose 1-epimerase